ncbi:MAG: hypothetical protein AB7H80_05355 [Candidatus Kapaibacterium sp.]
MQSNWSRLLTLFLSGTLLLMSCSEQGDRRSDPEEKPTTENSQKKETVAPTIAEEKGEKASAATAENEEEKASSAGEEKPVLVRFKKGTTGTELKGTITGYDVKEYLVGAAEGQQLEATLNSDNRFAFFVVDHVETNTRIFDGSMEGSSTVFTDLPHDGDYKFTILMPRAEARRDGVAHYTLELYIR